MPTKRNFQLFVSAREKIFENNIANRKDSNVKEAIKNGNKSVGGLQSNQSEHIIARVKGFDKRF